VRRGLIILRARPVKPVCQFLGIRNDGFAFSLGHPMFLKRQSEQICAGSQIFSHGLPHNHGLLYQNVRGVLASSSD